MQLTRKMKIRETEKYVAQKLGIDVMELTDEEVMHQVRQDLDIGTLPTIADCGFSSGIKDLGNTYF
jgi:dimethylamine--corrinoid protein Co-methyltransferase